MTQSDTLVDEAVARLNPATGSDHKRGCQGREYTCSCGHDGRRDAGVEVVLTALTEAQAENTRLKTEWMANVLSAETALRDELSEAKAGIERLSDRADELKDALHDLVMLHAQDDIGCVPAPTREQWSKAWREAEDLVRVEP